jgi:hypothetical protein
MTGPIQPMSTNYFNRYFTASALFLALSLSQLRAQTELIVNGGLESGNTPWVLSGGAEIDATAGYARTGLGYLFLGGVENEVDQTYQTITIPAGASSATLSFYYNIVSDEDFSGAFDTFTATVRNTSGTVLATVASKSNLDQDSGAGPTFYHQQTFNLLPYAGQTIRIQFNSSNDSSLVTSFDIDDVSVQVVSGPPVNDSCAGAIALSPGTPYTVNTAAATSAGDPAPVCQASFGKGVWFTYTPSSSGTVTISTCGSDFDTVLAVYSGSCGALTPFACNDDNGPACATTRASVSFSATSGTTYLILAGGSGGASGNLNIVASGPGGLQIIPTFGPSITGDPQSATIQATINAALALYQANFSNLITVTITFQEMGSGLGLSSTYFSSFSYSSYITALGSHSTTADDSTALALLPNSGSNPVNFNSSINLSLPLARALGYSGVNPPPGQTDGTISLNTSIMNLGLTDNNPSKYSLYATVCHEIDEVLGLGSALNGLNNGDPTPTGAISPEDLFRYDALGNRNFTTALSAAAYFSIDSTTDLAQFNQHQGGDFQDWDSFSGGGHPPRVQDAFATAGAQPVPNVELRVLDVIGYARVLPPPPVLSLLHSGNNVVLSWSTISTGFTLQSATNSLASPSWTMVTNVPAIVGGQFTVTNATVGTLKFYRLIQ